MPPPTKAPNTYPTIVPIPGQMAVPMKAPAAEPATAPTVLKAVPAIFREALLAKVIKSILPFHRSGNRKDSSTQAIDAVIIQVFLLKSAFWNVVIPATYIFIVEAVLATVVPPIFATAYEDLDNDNPLLQITPPTMRADLFLFLFLMISLIRSLRSWARY